MKYDVFCIKLQKFKDMRNYMNAYLTTHMFGLNKLMLDFMTTYFVCLK